MGVWRKRHISREAKVGMYEGIIEPSLLYGCETWALNKKDRKRMEAVEMNCLRNICGRRRIDMVPNVRIREICGKNVGVSERMDQGILRWFGHVERIRNERLVKRVYDSEVRGVRRRGRPGKSWMNGVNETLGRKGLNIQEAKDSVQNRNGWRSICRGGSLTSLGDILSGVILSDQVADCGRSATLGLSPITQACL